MDCCNPQLPALMVATCVSHPDPVVTSAWQTTEEERGNVILQVPCPGSPATKTCVRISISDNGASTSEHWTFQVKIGCSETQLKICNPHAMASPLTLAQWSGYFHQAFLSSPELLSAGAYAQVLSATGSPGAFKLELQICPGTCDLAMAVIENPALGPTTVSLSTIAGAPTAAMSGKFASYVVGVDGNVSLGMLSDMAPYAGFLQGGNKGPGTTDGCCVPVSCCPTPAGCCMLRRSGVVDLELAVPLTAADMTKGQIKIAQDANGNIAAFTGETAPAGMVALPVPHTVILSPGKALGNRLSVVLH